MNGEIAPSIHGLLFRTVAVLLSVATTLAPGGMAQDYWASSSRDDPLDEAWVWGDLTWMEGKGGIDWSSGESQSEDPAGRPPTESASGVPRPDEFVSGPFPRTIHLNASRLVQVDLYVPRESATARNPCEYSNDDRVRVDILVAGRLLAGITGIHRVSPREPTSPPANHFVCRYRLPIELDSIRQGEVVTLRLTYLVEMPSYRLGAGPEHQSQMRIPHYLTEDEFWRDPGRKYEFGACPVSENEGPVRPVLDLLPLVAPMAMGAGAALMSTKRRRLALAIVLLFCASSFGGCLDSSPTGPGAVNETLPDPDQYSRTRVENSTDEIPSEGKGDVIGIVHDPVFLPVAGAFVSILRTSNFSTTDAHGRFRFFDVSQGSFSLRVDKSGFQSIEVPITVVSQKVTRVEITLPPLNQTTSTMRPHRHDYWDGKDTLLVLNYSHDAPNGVIYLPPKKIDKPNTIIPGTYEVEVILDWDPLARGTSQYGLVVQGNEDPSPQNRSVFQFRPPRTPFHIMSNWEMTDNGHQPFSTWSFGIYRHPFYEAQAVYDPLAASRSRTIQFIVILHRGVVPLEPAHPDHWRGAHRLTLDEGKTASGPNSLSILVDDTFGFGGCFRGAVLPDEALNIRWGTPARVVPVETTNLNLSATFNRKVPEGPAGYSWELWYKPGDSLPPVGDSYAKTSAPNFRKADPAVVADLVWNWTIPLKAGMADGIYNKRSTWYFFLAPSNYAAVCIDAHAAALTGPWKAKWQVDAIRGIEDVG